MFHRQKKTSNKFFLSTSVSFAYLMFFIIIIILKSNNITELLMIIQYINFLNVYICIIKLFA